MPVEQPTNFRLVVFVWQKTEIRAREGPRPAPPLEHCENPGLNENPASFLPDEKRKSECAKVPDPPARLALGGWGPQRESRVVFAGRKTEIRVREGPSPPSPPGIRPVVAPRAPLALGRWW